MVLKRSRSMNRTATCQPAAVGFGTDRFQRRPENAAIGKPGQRIFGGEPRNIRLGLAPLGDVGEGLDEATVRQMAAAHLDDVPFGICRSEIVSLPPLSLVNDG